MATSGLHFFNQSAATQELSSGHYLALYFIPSKTGIHWDSPSVLARSALRSKVSYYKRFIGHVHVEHFEVRDSHIKRHFLTGMQGRKMNAVEVLMKGAGLGVVFHSFPGMLEDSLLAHEEIEKGLKNRKINFALFRISPESADGINRYLDIFTQLEVYKRYGLVHNPLSGEGAGCSAFGMSFLKLLDGIAPWMLDEWSHEVRLPESFIGPPARHGRISLASFLVRRLKWAEAKEPGYDLFYWDPDRMAKSIERIQQGAHRQFVTQFVSSNQDVSGPLFDISSNDFREDLLGQLASIKSRPSIDYKKATNRWEF